MARIARFVRLCGGACLLLVALESAACTGRYRSQQANDVAGLADPSATYTVVLEAVKARKYKILAQDPATRTVRVHAHVGETDVEGGSVIQLRVSGGRVQLSATGYLVRRDGAIHRSLHAELSSLSKLLKERLSVSSTATASTPAAASSVSGAANAPLPVAWSEPAYDPEVWGRGNFTCLPVQLADSDQAQLTLELSNGETADVLLSLAHAPELCRSAAECKLAHAPELCRSAAECKLAGGCPALGIADAGRVNRLAGRLSKREIDPLATLFLRGRPIAKFDLSKHGSIAQAMAEKH